MRKRVALVTGGTRGIGFGIAESLAKERFDVAVCGVRPPDQVTEPIAALQTHGGEVIYCQCDVASAEARLAMLNQVRNHYGKLHVLVNNAGVAPRQRLDILEADEASFERVLKTNLQGPYFLSQSAANWMVEQKQADSTFEGCMINVSSVSASLASTSRGEYCVSKAGLSMATQLFAMRLAEYDLPVFEIRPGIVATDMTAGVKEKYDALIAEGLVPQVRWGRAEDIGKAVAALARGDFAYSTGQVIVVDGGLTIPRL